MSADEKDPKAERPETDKPWPSEPQPGLVDVKVPADTAEFNRLGRFLGKQTLRRRQRRGRRAGQLQEFSSVHDGVIRGARNGAPGEGMKTSRHPPAAWASKRSS